MTSPARCRQLVSHVQAELGISERRACRVLQQPRSTQRYQPVMAADTAALTARVIALASEYGRYGYRRVTALLRNEGWPVNPKRVERIWRREGLKVPAKQPKRGRLWLNDGSCMRLRPQYTDHVWSYDFMQDRTHNGAAYRILNIIDEFSRECLCCRVARQLNSCRCDRRPHWACSAHGGSRPIFALTMARNSPPGGCASGWTGWRSNRCSSSQAAPGKMATSRASTAKCGMSCSTAKSSIR